MESAMLLSLLSVAFVHPLFGIAMLQKGVVDPLWMTTYLAVVLLYTCLYFHRLRELHAGLRRRLRNAAVSLAMFLSAFFFYNFAAGMSWWTAVAVWLFLVVVAYLSYDGVMLDPEPASEVTAATRLPI
jgi:hypothetical protein